MPLLLLSFLGVGKTLFGAVAQWLSRRSLAEIAAIALAIVCLVEFVALKSEQRHARKLESQLIKTVSAREADRAAYVKAQADAAVRNIVQVAAVKQKQQDINNAKVSYLTGRLQLISDELRKQDAAAQRAPGSAPANPGVEGPCRAFDPAWLCLSPADRLRAAQNEERHDELIDLVIEQSAVDPNAPVNSTGGK